MKLSWSVKLSRDFRFHFQGKSLTLGFLSFHLDNQCVLPSRIRVKLKLYEHKHCINDTLE